MCTRTIQLKHLVWWFSWEFQSSTQKIQQCLHRTKWAEFDLCPSQHSITSIECLKRFGRKLPKPNWTVDRPKMTRIKIGRYACVDAAFESQQKLKYLNASSELMTIVEYKSFGIWNSVRVTLRCILHTSRKSTHCRRMMNTKLFYYNGLRRINEEHDTLRVKTTDKLLIKIHVFVWLFFLFNFPVSKENRLSEENN